MNTEFQDKATLLGNGCKCEEFAVKIFAEETIRGSLFFALSMVLKKIEGFIREKANLGSWLVISPGSIEYTGVLVHKPNLREVMMDKFSEPTILVVNKITGEEEVPENVGSILLMHADDYPDVLAHMSVRARNCNIVVGVLFDESEANEIMKKVGKGIKV
jgi:alpha-glucan,water dikinase